MFDDDDEDDWGDDDERECDECGNECDPNHCWRCGGYFCDECDDNHECLVDDFLLDY